MNEDTKPKNYQNKFLFDYLKNILLLKSEKVYSEHISDESINSFPHLVIMRYLSMSTDERVRKIITDNQILLERLDKISHKLSYRWYIDNIPKQKSSFITYIK